MLGYGREAVTPPTYGIDSIMVAAQLDEGEAMPAITFEQLRDATAGGSVALRSVTRLQPVGGPGDKVFPPSYAVESRAEHKYAVEERQVDDRVVSTVLLDSVASQANRAELALLDGWESGDLAFPVPYVDFTGYEDVADIGRLTALEAPHRFADAIFRDSLLGGTLFRLSDIGRAVTDASPRNAADLFRTCPTALLFGMWDSTGPKGGLGSKFQRSYVSEIVGLDAQIGRKVGSRIDPLQIERLAEEDRAFNHEDSDQVWTFDAEEAEKDAKGKPVLASRGSEAGTPGLPSKINHGNVAPSIDALAGGVTVSEAVQTTVISLAALRRLRFAGRDRATETAARTAIAGAWCCGDCLPARDGLRPPFSLSVDPTAFPADRACRQGWLDSRGGGHRSGDCHLDPPAGRCACRQDGLGLGDAGDPP